MSDLRSQLPECPLEYEVPRIPVTHTALVIAINAADIDWQAKMLPWTLASLINNTDLIMNGVHLYIACEDGTEDRIRIALSLFDLPENTIIEIARKTELHSRYDAVYEFNINHWAFRDSENQIKLPIEHLLKSDVDTTFGYASSKEPQLCNMRQSTKDMFRHAIKQLMGSQLAMKI